MKKLLRLPTYVHLEYKVHRDSLTDGSSFRNTSVWRPSHAPRGASWNGPAGSEPADGGQHGYSKSRTHTSQPPGGVTGDGTAWGGGPAGARGQHHHQGGGGGNWKNNNISTNTSHSVIAGTALISPTLGGDMTAGGEKPANFWGKSKDGTTLGSSSWGRTIPATTPTGGSFQHKGPDDERGGNYGDVEGRNPRTSRYPLNAPASEGAEGGTGVYQSRRRYDGTAGQPIEGQVVIDQKKRTLLTINQADQVRVWGRAQIVIADPAPLPPGELPASP
jgi:hypothetical protein